MIREGPRPRDIVLVCESAILGGTLAASTGWYMEALLPVLTIFSVVAASLIWPKKGIVAAMAFIGTCLCSFAYAQFRGSGTGMPWLGGAAPTSFLAQGITGFIRDPFLSYPASALLGALLSGSSGGLPDGMRAAMESSGNSYLVGMYGYKMHILGETAMTFFGSALPRAAALSIGIILIGLFIAAAGAPVSALRAGAMICASSVAELFGRRADRNVLMLLVATGMVLWNPGIWGSRGFLLSFLSIIGIHLLSPPLERIFAQHIPVARFFERVPGGAAFARMLSFHAVTATAVNVAIFPTVSLLYGSFPLISFISNIFAGVPLGAILWLGIGATAAHASLRPATALFAAPLAPLLGYETAIFHMFAGVPLSIPSSVFPTAALIAYYAALLAVVLRSSPHN